MSLLGDFGKAIAQSIRGPHLRPRDEAQEIRVVLKEQDRNIDSNRRLRMAANGVVARLAAKDHR